LGFEYWKTRRLAEAEAELTKAIELDPGFSDAKLYLADAYLTDLKPSRSVPLLQSIVVREPGYVRARLDLGKAYFQMERYPAAATELEEVIRLDPDRPEAHYQLARVYQKLNQPDKFHEQLEAAKKLQARKLSDEESVMAAAGARGDATQQLGLSPSPAPPEVKH
jgi:Tfp pilus assembly protein PilF